MGPEYPARQATLSDWGDDGFRGVSVVVVVVEIVVVGPAVVVGPTVVVGPAVVVGGFVTVGGWVVAGGTVVVGTRLCVMARTAPAASTIPPEATRFLRRVSGAEVSMRMFLMALGIRLGWIDRMSATSPVM